MEKNKSREQSTRSDVVRQLKAVRKEQHITQEVLAERAGTKKSNISRLESGRYNPRGKILTGMWNYAELPMPESAVR